MSRIKRYDGTDWQPLDAAAVSTPSTPAFSPWDLSRYPEPTHAVWASDPDWSNPGDGNAVSSWRNPGSPHVTQGTSGSRPLYRASTVAFNNRPTVEFDGSDDYIEADITDISQPFVLVAVANTGGANATAEGVIGSSGTNSTRIGDSGADAFTYNFGTAQTGGTTDSDPHVWVALINGASSQLRIDGTQVVTGNSGAGSLVRFTLGCSRSTNDNVARHFLDGHIAYAAVYELSSVSDVADLEEALGTYYGISIA